MPPERVVIPGGSGSPGLTISLYMARRSLLAALIASLVALVPGGRARGDRARERARAHERRLRLAGRHPVDAWARRCSTCRSPSPRATGRVHDARRPAGSDADLHGQRTTSSYSEPAPDGTYCYYIQAADLLTTANSPGLTVVVDTLTRPPRSRSPASRRRRRSAAPSASPGRARTPSRASPRASCTWAPVGACAVGPVIGLRHGTPPPMRTAPTTSATSSPTAPAT